VVLLVRTAWLVAVLCGPAACGAVSTPTAAGTTSPSASPSPAPSPSPSCVPYPDVDDPLAARSKFIREGGLDTLVIAAGPRLCTGTSDTALPVSLAYVTFGPAHSRATRSGQHELVGSYDGSRELRIHFPILGSPCLGAAVYLGVGDIGDKQLPSTPFTGVEDGPQLYRTNPDDALTGRSDVTWGLLAVDATAGKKCSSVLRRAK